MKKFKTVVGGGGVFGVERPDNIPKLFPKLGVVVIAMTAASSAEYFQNLMVRVNNDLGTKAAANQEL